MWVLICVAIVIVIIIFLLIIILHHSCDATLVGDGSEIILVGKAINEQGFIAIGYIPSITHGKLLNTLDNPGWHGDLLYFLLACKHSPCL